MYIYEFSLQLVGFTLKLSCSNINKKKKTIINWSWESVRERWMIMKKEINDRDDNKIR